MWDDDEIVWEPDQKRVYMGIFERFFHEPNHPVVMIWPKVIRDKYGLHFVYKLNRGHMHEGEIISSTDSTLEFRWEHSNGDTEVISVHPLTDEEFKKVQQEYPVYKCQDDILNDYIAAY